METQFVLPQCLQFSWETFFLPAWEEAIFPKQSGRRETLIGNIMYTSGNIMLPFLFCTVCASWN